MRKFLLYAALLTLTQCSKCKDDEPAPRELQLPAETQTGANRLGFRLNGQVWLLPIISTAPTLSAEHYGNTLVVNATGLIRATGNQASQHLKIEFDSLVQTGIYRMDGQRQRIYFSENTSSCDYLTTPSQPGTVEITRFDPVARIVAGRFAFRLQQAGCPTVEATEGRFDVTF